MAFENPQGFLEYRGEYGIELVNGTNTENIPSGVDVNRWKVRVGAGRIQQSTHGIIFYANEHPFSWGNSYIKCIRDGTGSLLWVNSSFKNQITE